MIDETLVCFEKKKGTPHAGNGWNSYYVHGWKLCEVYWNKYSHAWIYTVTYDRLQNEASFSRFSNKKTSICQTLWLCCSGEVFTIMTFLNETVSFKVFLIIIGNIYKNNTLLNRAVFFLENFIQINSVMAIQKCFWVDPQIFHQ